MRRIPLLLLWLVILVSPGWTADEDPLETLKEETFRLFTPMTGKITDTGGAKVTINIGAKDGVRTGMRMTVLSVGEAFLHPVTRQVLGNVESASGRIQVIETRDSDSVGEIVEGNARIGDKVRISESKMPLTFIQDRRTDWYLADDYYRRLKNTGRMAMRDTALETADVQQAVEEGKRLGAEAVLLLTAKEAEKGTLLRQRLFWTSDGRQFFDREIKVDIAFSKELKFGADLFGPSAGEALLKYRLPYNARFVTTGDYDGDGKQEVMISDSNSLRGYVLGMDLEELWQVKESVRDEHIWIDSADIDGNGRDELIVTSRRDDDVFSFIYRLDGSAFVKIWEGKSFVRWAGGRLLSQSGSIDGYDGPVTVLRWKGGIETGDKVTLPKGVNLYDFVQFEDAATKESYILAYDEKGHVNLYDNKGIRTWRSASDTGGFLTTFKRKAPASYIQEETWSIKDRLLIRNKEVLVMQRVPLADMAKGLGFKNSRVKSFWWNGFSMEESVLIDDVAGTIFDYAQAGDKLVVLSSPFLGINFGNILKGENPLGTSLFIYSVRGR